MPSRWLIAFAMVCGLGGVATAGLWPQPQAERVLPRVAGVAMPGLHKAALRSPVDALSKLIPACGTSESVPVQVQRPAEI